MATAMHSIALVAAGGFAVVLSGCGGGSDDTTGAPSPSPPAWVACEHILKGTPKDDKDTVPTAAEHDAALENLNMEDVKEDMVKLLTDSNPCWPADKGNYAGLM